MDGRSAFGHRHRLELRGHLNADREAEGAVQCTYSASEGSWLTSLETATTLDFASDVGLFQHGLLQAQTNLFDRFRERLWSN